MLRKHLDIMRLMGADHDGWGYCGKGEDGLGSRPVYYFTRL